MILYVLNLSGIVWFDGLDGPKELLWQDGQFLCWIGFNLQITGQIRGFELSATGASVIAAILDVKRQYEEAT